MTGGRPVLRDITIQARGHLALQVDRGQHLRVIDVEGQQPLDLIALDRVDPTEKLSMAMTRQITARWNLAVGMSMFSSLARPMLTVISETVGIHNLAGGCCNRFANVARFGPEANGPNCYDNFVAAAAELGLGPQHVQLDMVLNAFMKWTYRDDGRRIYDRTASKAGDHIEMRAEMDLLVAISNCPQERGNVTGPSGPTALRVVVLGTTPVRRP